MTGQFFDENPHRKIEGLAAQGRIVVPPSMLITWPVI
jgi:hypothetical protein